jgi:hypothetical protein
VAGKSLEEINLLFTSESLIVSENMKEYHRRLDEAGGSVAVAARRLLDEVDGISELDPHRVLETVPSTEKTEKGDDVYQVEHLA